jgi:MHS family proline/betaine transporter-like MFS transporter
MSQDARATPSPDLTQPSAPTVDRTTARRVTRAGVLGTILEYYDISLYGLLAVVLAPQFFPASDPAVSTIAALSVFGTAYIVRPLGGMFFGWLGDRYGRRTTLMVTILVTCFFSAAIGALPTHAAIGIAAPILLVFVRLGQGFGAGGESMGATTYVMESVPPNKRGWYTCMVPMGATMGFAASAIVVGTVTAIVPAEAFTSWGWRIPFLLALPFGLVCLWMRLRLEDSVEFNKIAATDKKAKAPLLEALRTAPLAILRVVAYTAALSTVAHVVMVYVSVLLIQQLGYDKNTVYWLTAVVMALGALSTPLFGAWSDRVGRRALMIGAAVGTIVLFIPLFFVLTTATNLFIAGVVFVGLVVLGQSFSPGYTVFVESFPTRIRYTASAFGFNIGIVIAGFAPAISAELVKSTGSLLSPSYLATGAAVLGLIAALTVRDQRRRTT